MVEQPNLKEPENDVICCCAAGPLFLVGNGGAKDIPIPTWSEEWLSWKSAIALLTHAFSLYFPCLKDFRPFRRDITQANVVPNTKRLLSEVTGSDSNV